MNELSYFDLFAVVGGIALSVWILAGQWFEYKKLTGGSDE